MKSCLYSVLLFKYPLDEIFKFANEIGCTGVEIMGKGWKGTHIGSDSNVFYMKTLKKLADDMKLEIVDVATYVDGFCDRSDADCKIQFAEMQKYLDIADILGSKYVRVGPGATPVKEAQEYHYTKAAYWLQKCCDEAKKHNKKLLMEIHFGGIIENADSTLKLLKMVNRDHIGLTFDPANWLCQGVPYDVEVMKSLYRYIWHFHVKDVKILKEKKPGCVEVEGRFSEFVALGDGDMEYKQYFKELKNSKYEGYITIESHASGWDLKDLAKNDNEKVKKLWAEA